MTFKGCVSECLRTKSFVENFNRLTGNKLLVPCSPINAAIDSACGYDPNKDAMRDFIGFVFTYVWMPLIRQKQKEDAVDS